MVTFSELLPPQASSPHNGIHWTPSQTQAGSGLLTIHTARATWKEWAWVIYEGRLAPETIEVKDVVDVKPVVHAGRCELHAGGD